MDELKELSKIMREEYEKQESEWIKTKEELTDIIEPKYFDFVEGHESYISNGYVNIIETKERISGYSHYSHCRVSNDSLLYIKHNIELETENSDSKYEGSDIEYWVWQTTGYCGDDYSGFLLLPMLDGRYWKVSYTC